MIVFKQWYKPRADPSTPELNVKHLQYIATRPGAIRNKGCGFGLWGQMPRQGPPHDIMNLKKARAQVREASKRLTIYRAVISMGREASEKGYYDREKWERLVENHVAAIAKEMDIRPEHFCWMASMHYTKGHPHVHLVYWDNGADPRPEFISKERFEIMAEHIRADFGKEVYREELKEAQGLQRAEIKRLRTELQAICREANPEAALNLQKLEKSPQVKAIAEGLAEIVRRLPTRGSLDYGYLPPECTALVDALVDRCLELPELQGQWEKYRKATGQISDLYGNGEETAARNLGKAETRLRKELGNEVMKAVRELTRELKGEHPQDREALRELLRDSAAMVARESEVFRHLLDPAQGQSMGHREAMDQIVKDTVNDPRLRYKIQGLADSEIKAAGWKYGSEEAKKLSKEIYRDAYREVRQAVTRELQAELGAGHPENREGLTNLIHTTAATVAKANPMYQELLAAMPPERIPWSEMEVQIPIWRESLDRIVEETVIDYRVRFYIQGYVEGEIKAAGAEPDSAEAKEISRDIYRDVYRNLRRDVTENLRGDAGWNLDAAQVCALGMLCSMMRCTSQIASQQEAHQCQAKLNTKFRSKDKSKEAKKDYWATQTQAGSWELE